MKKCSTYKIDVSQNKITFTFHLLQLEWPYSRAIETTNAGKDPMKQDPLYTVGGNVH
jgi:hypothetical protein